MIDISPFCVRYEVVGPEYVRLAVHCAPGNAKELARQLAKYSARVKNRGCIVVRVPLRVAQLSRQMGVDEAVCDALDRYALTWRGATRGLPVPELARKGRRESVRALLAALGRPYPFGSGSDSHDIPQELTLPPSPPPAGPL